MRILWLLFFCSVLSVSLADENDSPLGYGNGLAGEDSSQATVLPKQPVVNVPQGVRPVIVLPPESLSGYMLIAPFPDSNAAPVVIRDNKKEEVATPYGTLPQTDKKLPLAPVVH